MSDVVWKPPAELVEKSRIKAFMNLHGIGTYDELIARASEDQDWFWRAAVEHLGIEWFRPYEKLMDSSRGIPWTTWFLGGKINIVHNVLDRHARSWRRNKVAITWEGEDGRVRKLTYRDVYVEVNRAANALKGLGLNKGDTVGIYMPFVPEIVIQLLACLKIGVICIPIFSGFAAPAVAERLANAGAKLLFTGDGTLRRGKPVEIKKSADEAVALAPSVRHVVVFRHIGIDVPWTEGRDIGWDDFLKGQSRECPTEPLDSEDVALIIYTSGTTGRPKGTVHTHAGTLVQMAKEVGYFMDVRDEDLFWWVTDIGWMMGPWMIIGGMHFGGSIFLFDGAPNWPAADRLWDMIERHGVTLFGISPTAVRMFMRSPEEMVTKHDLSSLRMLGSTGEPWDPDSWTWFFEKIGQRRCPIINISGGTDIVGCFLAPLPICDLKPCTLRGPALGMAVDVWDEKGKPVRGEVGYLVAKKPAPSMTRGIWGDPKRYLESYWSRWENVWDHGDWTYVDEDGFWFLRGRADDTIKVAGHRIGPAEIEAALIEHEAVSEAAAIGVPHEIKGESIACFVVLKPAFEPGEALRDALKDQVVKVLGKTDRPDDVRFVRDLPKTRSAKIVRRLIKARYLGKTDLGDLSSIENPDAIEEIARAR